MEIETVEMGARTSYLILGSDVEYPILSMFFKREKKFWEDQTQEHVSHVNGDHDGICDVLQSKNCSC